MDRCPVEERKLYAKEPKKTSPLRQHGSRRVYFFYLNIELSTHQAISLPVSLSDCLSIWLFLACMSVSVEVYMFTFVYIQRQKYMRSVSTQLDFVYIFQMKNEMLSLLMQLSMNIWIILNIWFYVNFLFKRRPNLNYS